MRPQIIRFTVIAMLIVCGSAAAATVWKWMDKTGVVHYSDQPVPGAVQVDLNVQTYDADEARIPTTSRPTRQQNRNVGFTYQSIEISSPSNEETIVGTGGVVSVSLEINPGVQPSHSVRLEMDGQRVSEPDSTATSFNLQDVPRGAHTLTASVVSADGQVLIQSQSVTFFVQQPTIRSKK